MDLVVQGGVACSRDMMSWVFYKRIFCILLYILGEDWFIKPLIQELNRSCFHWTKPKRYYMFNRTISELLSLMGLKRWAELWVGTQQYAHTRDKATLLGAESLGICYSNHVELGVIVKHVSEYFQYSFFSLCFHSNSFWMEKWVSNFSLTHKYFDLCDRWFPWFPGCL